MTAWNHFTKRLETYEDLLFVFIGDSITYGENHCTPDETYVACLARLLAEAFPDIDIIRYDGTVESERLPLQGYKGPFFVQRGKKERCGSITFVRSGVGGNTVARAIARKEDFCRPLGRMPDIYFTMFGINDALAEDKEKYVSPDVFYRNYQELLGELRKASPAAELVLMTPTYNDDGKTPESHLLPYCEMVKLLASETGAHLIDTHALWMAHLKVGTEHYGQGDWLSDKLGDQCHFSPKGSLETAKFIWQEWQK